MDEDVLFFDVMNESIFKREGMSWTEDLSGQKADAYRLPRGCLTDRRFRAERARSKIDPAPDDIWCCTVA